jgi:redox-sensitive bicupin YhaK (pirin superfamily)
MPIDLIEGKSRDLGGFSVRRVLPALSHRAVGPFVFFDHLGPAILAPGDGIQVRPHPHIGLATVTFLFDGEIVHRDSLGSVQTIRPGDVNWMTSGRGIVHSERSSPEGRERERPVHGLQSWVALPRERENDAPAFAHHPAATLPRVERAGCRLTIVAGHAFGERSPVDVLVPTLYAVAEMDDGATLEVPAGHDERAVYVVEGEVLVDDTVVADQVMAVLEPGRAALLRAPRRSRVMLLGGARLDAPRALEWNFVASDRQAIASARDDWAGYPNARFPQVPGEREFIPLPPRPGEPVPL